MLCDALDLLRLCHLLYYRFGECSFRITTTNVVSILLIHFPNLNLPNPSMCVFDCADLSFEGFHSIGEIRLVSCLPWQSSTLWLRMHYWLVLQLYLWPLHRICMRSE